MTGKIPSIRNKYINKRTSRQFTNWLINNIDYAIQMNDDNPKCDICGDLLKSNEIARGAGICTFCKEAEGAK